MKLGKIAIAAVVATVIMFLLEWLWYGMIMKDSMVLPNARPEPNMVMMVLGDLIFSFAFVYIFTQGRGSGTPIGEGARFGIWAALLVFVSMGFVWYSLTTMMTLQQVLVDDVFRIVEMIIMGIVVAYLTDMGGARGKGATGGDD